MTDYKITSEKNLPESELQIGVEIPYEAVAPYRAEVLKKIAKTASLPGFRVGHVPEKVLIEKVGELHILEEAAYAAVEESLPEILKAKQIQIVGEPRVSVTKLAAGNPITFTVAVSVLPEVKLPDYKKIAAAENAKPTEEASVSEKELDDFLEGVRKSYAKNSPPGDATGALKESLPELSDEFVKNLGDFKDVADFKTKIRENLSLEKKQKAREKKRLTIAEAILKKTETAVPKALIESELAKLLARFHDDIARMGMKTEDYLKHVKKTEEDVRKDWRGDAEKRGKLQLVLDAVARAEKIEAPQEAVEAEMKHLLEHYKDADPARGRAYVAMTLVNEKVFEFLERQKA